jgi:hypothetical protein
MNAADRESVANFFESLESIESNQMMEMVSKHLNDEDIEVFVNHIADFYGLDDEEELGMLAQIMITGFLAAKQTTQLQ